MQEKQTNCQNEKERELGSVAVLPGSQSSSVALMLKFFHMVSRYNDYVIPQAH